MTNTPTPVPAASERMTAEWAVPFCLNCGHEIPPRPDILAHVATLSARAEAAEARAERARAEALGAAALIVAGQSVAVNHLPTNIVGNGLVSWLTERDFKAADAIRALLTAPPPTAKEG